MEAYLFNGLEEWSNKHQADYTKPHHKQRAVIMKDSSLKKQLPKNITYGEQPKKGQMAIKEYHINGHTIKLWDNGNLSCDCLGWIMKRANVKRECTHCREIYGQLTNKPKPDKTPKPNELELLANRLAELLIE